MISEECFKVLEAIVMATTGEERESLLINLFNRQQYIDESMHVVVGQGLILEV